MYCEVNFILPYEKGVVNMLKNFPRLLIKMADSNRAFSRTFPLTNQICYLYKLRMFSWECVHVILSSLVFSVTRRKD